MDPELAAVNKEVFKGTKTPPDQLNMEGYFACFICDRLLEASQRYGQFKSGSACRFCTILMKRGMYFLGLKKPFSEQQQKEYEEWKSYMNERKGCIWKPRRKGPHPLLAIVNSKNITATTGDGTPISMGLLLTAPDSPLNTPEFIEMFTQMVNGQFTGIPGANMTINGTTTVNNIDSNGKKTTYTTKNGQGLDPMSLQQLQALGNIGQQQQNVRQQQQSRVATKVTPRTAPKATPRAAPKATPRVAPKATPRVAPKTIQSDSDDSDEPPRRTTPKKVTPKASVKVANPRLPATIPLKVPPTASVSKKTTTTVSLRGPGRPPVKRTPRAPAKKPTNNESNESSDSEN